MKDFFSGEPLSPHPSNEELAAYISERVPVEERARVEEHLVECRDCRREVTSARRFVRQNKSLSGARWILPVAAAAVLAIVLLRPNGRTPAGEAPTSSEKRAARSDPAPTIPILLPPSGAIVEPGSVSFAWRGQPDRPLYKLTLIDGSGRAVWSAETRDTVLAPPRSVVLARGRNYFWTVDALGADGRSLTTRTQRFSTAP